MYRHPEKQKQIKNTEKEVQKILSKNSATLFCTNEECKNKVKCTEDESNRIYQCTKCNKGFLKKPAEENNEKKPKQKYNKRKSKRKTSQR